jgi:hypothetical protein
MLQYIYAQVENIFYILQYGQKLQIGKLTDEHGKNDSSVAEITQKEAVCSEIAQRKNYVVSITNYY